MNLSMKYLHFRSFSLQGEYILSCETFCISAKYRFSVKTKLPNHSANFVLSLNSTSVPYAPMNHLTNVFLHHVCSRSYSILIVTEITNWKIRKISSIRSENPKSERLLVAWQILRFHFQLVTCRGVDVDHPDWKPNQAIHFADCTVQEGCVLGYDSEDLSGHGAWFRLHDHTQRWELF